ncbi:MAG: hypothetical protein M9955_20150 [Rhizobiaceae bacterium]|nr:hypothetical protein [Rhizobiaceae bacterium]
MFCRVRFDRRGFQWAMREAWRRANATARKAMIPSEEREARAATIRLEIEMLKYKPFAVSIERIERQLRAQLEAIL